MMNPAGSAKPLPEERLLKLIRGQSAATPAPGGARASSAHQPAGRATGHHTKVTDLPWSRIALGGLWVLLGLEVVMVLAQLLHPAPVIGRSTGGTPAPESRRPPVSVEDIPSLAQAAAPALFRSPEGSAPEPRSARTATKSNASAKLLASRLTLMGIVPGNPPQAVIEDAQTKKSYFVSQGQVVVEDAVLDQVLENRVILDLDGQKIELTL